MMKKLINNSKLMAIAIMVTLTLTSVQTFAKNKGDNPVEFKYIGSTNNQPVFLLNLHNTETEEFEVTLKDKYGEILYKEKVGGIDITRRYRLNTPDVDASKITVEISSKKDHAKVIYAVTTSSRVIEDVTVNRL